MATIDLADELEIEEGADGLEVVDEVAWVLGDGPCRPGTGVTPLIGAVLAVPLGRRTSSSGHWPPLAGVPGCGCDKRIPAGAGLGGGSSDAAAVLRWAGALDPAVAAGLGADVPFCVVGGRALVSGIGELVEPLGFEAFTAVLVTPALAVPTPEVYRAWDALGGPSGEHGNDLEPAAARRRATLGLVARPDLGVAGDRPRLAGSGGTWYLERDPEAAAHLVVELQGAVRAERGGPSSSLRRALLTGDEGLAALPAAWR